MKENLSRREFVSQGPLELAKVVGFAALAGASIVEHSNIQLNRGTTQDLEQRVANLEQILMQQNQQYQVKPDTL